MQPDEITELLEANAVELVKNAAEMPANELRLLYMKWHYGEEFSKQLEDSMGDAKMRANQDIAKFMGQLLDSDDIYLYDGIRILCGSAGFVIIRGDVIVSKLALTKS